MKIFGKVFPALLLAFLLFGLGNSALAASSVSLGTAGGFAVLGGSTVTNTGSSVVNGDLGLSPGSSLTGFPPGTVNGIQHITDAAAAQAQADLVAAYNAAGGQTGAVTVSGDLGGMILTPGVYHSASSLGLTGALTLDGQGNPDAVFVFQIGSALTTASASNVNLINGAQACNVFWQVASSATLGTNSNFTGTLLAMQSITATTGTVVNGRMLARNGAVTMDINSVTRPICTTAPAPVVAPTPVPAPLPIPLLTMPATAPAGLSAPAPSLAVPQLPSTGVGPKNSGGLPWNVVIPMGALVILSAFYLARKKRTV